jgi:glycine dehydrogenase
MPVWSSARIISCCMAMKAAAMETTTVEEACAQTSEALKCMLQDKCHPQTIAVCQSRADGLGLKVLVSSEEDFKFDKDVSGILLQYPATDGAVHDYKVS